MPVKFRKGIDLVNRRAINVATPTAATDAANKSYVDGLVSGAVDSEIRVHTQTVAQASWTIDHDLGHDPILIQVLVDGVPVDEWNTSFPIPNQRVLLGFDVAIAGIARLM